jgi:hypothetical protein
MDERDDVPTRRVTRVADGEDTANVGERQPGRLGVADEPEPDGSLGRVIAVASRGTRRRGQQARLLVEADGAGRQSGRRRDFTDAHGLRLGLDLQAHCKVYLRCQPREAARRPQVRRQRWR